MKLSSAVLCPFRQLKSLEVYTKGIGGGNLPITYRKDSKVGKRVCNGINLPVLGIERAWGNVEKSLRKRHPDRLER